jgi:peptidoglycan/xylan/chitin deacetylase (PgdA/CDA1 family)
MRTVRDAGFEVGVHTWDHIRWQDNVCQRDAVWTRQEMVLAVARFEEIFGHKPLVHGAAGWQMNDAAYAQEKELGFGYASDGRGGAPFQPIDSHGADMGVPQIPTTLPTLDELIGIDGWHAGNVHEHLLKLTATPPEYDHVYTLHSELEGMKMLATFDRLLSGWKQQGYQLVACRDLHATLDRQALERRQPKMGELPGRSGLVAI